MSKHGAALHFPTPDWQKQRVILVDPAQWQRYKVGRSDLRPLFAQLQEVLRDWGVEVETLGRTAAPLDIWIRDWGSVEGAFFQYAPDYAKGLYSQGAVERAVSALNARVHVPFRFRCSPLVLDGGNLVHNGRVALVTRKVFLDNPRWTRREIEESICWLGFERVVFLPIEPGDEIGHADGMCRFLDPQTLLVNDYAGTPLALFGRQLRSLLRSARLDAEMLPFPWFCRGGRRDGVPSAIGCYINFLHVAAGIVVPRFAHRYDERAVELLTKAAGRPVTALDATPLAELGGVFNCISLSL